MTSRSILLAGGGTGGHVFPMIAVADCLRALAPSLRLVFVGTQRGIETDVVPARGYELELVSVAPIRGRGVAGALRGAVRAVGALPEARRLVAKYDPRALLSIGGYAAGPVSLTARARGVPLALIEPNAVMGLANRLVAPFVQRAYTAFPECEAHFPAGTVRRSGVPIRAGFSPSPYARRRGPLRVLVLGGSQGARALNETLPAALARAETPVAVTHQAGPGNEGRVAERYAGLGAGARAQVVPFIDDMPAAIRSANLVVGRSGASAVSEICAVGRPSVLVPYPFASGDHQRKNAESLARDGAAVCVLEQDLEPERIAAIIDGLAADKRRLPTMAECARARGRPNAARTIAADLLALAGLMDAPAGTTRAASGSDGDDGAGSRRQGEARP